MVDAPWLPAYTRQRALVGGPRGMPGRLFRSQKAFFFLVSGSRRAYRQVRILHDYYAAAPLPPPTALGMHASSSGLAAVGRLASIASAFGPPFQFSLT